MRACGLAPYEVRERILKALKRKDLIIMAHVAAGAWALQSRYFATREEEEQAQQEARAATKKYDLDAYTAVLFERSPSPDGIIGPIEPESWEFTVTIAIRDEHLVIEFLFPKFPPESYSFAIATPEAVDELLAAASPAQEQSKSPPAPPDPEKWLTSVQAEFAQVSRKKRSAWVRDTAYPRMERELGGNAPWKDWGRLKRAMYPRGEKKFELRGIGRRTGRGPPTLISQ